MSVAAYRKLWRAANIAFQGDNRVLTAAHQRIRQGFREQATRAPTDPSVALAIKRAEDIARILRENVVQGKRYDSSVYKLRIHEDTERGDNDSVKTAGSVKATVDGCSCS